MNILIAIEIACMIYIARFILTGKGYIRFN